MAQIFACSVIFTRNMYYRSCHVAVVPVGTAHFHELAVAAIVCLALYHCLYAFSGYLGNFADQGLIDVTFVRSYNGLRNRMARKALAAGSNIQQFSTAYDIRMNVIYCKHAFCKRSGLIENNSIDLRQHFHISGAFYQDTVLGCAADAAEERQRNGYDQCAGAGYNKEYAGSRKPDLPNFPIAYANDHRRNHSQNNSCDNNYRRVISRKLCDEVFYLCLLVGRIFDEFQYLRYSALSESRCCLYLNNASEIKSSGNYIIAESLIDRRRFARKGSLVNGALAFDNDTVERNLFAGLNDDDLSNFNLIRRHFYFLTVTNDARAVRPDIHELGDGFSRSADSNALEKLTYLVEEHYRRCLRVFTSTESADSSDHHEELLIENLAVDQIDKSRPKYIVTRNNIRNRIDNELSPPGELDEV